MSTERGRAWRRAKNRLKKSKGMGSSEWFKPEKNWKRLYLRSVKIARAQQLGFVYPRQYLHKQEYDTDD